MATPPLVGFQSQKAAQVCAYFATAAGDSIEKLKLIKLVYLAEREHVARYSSPMLYDELYSLQHGPVCSSTLYGIDGHLRVAEWDAFIKRSGNDVSAKTPLDRGALEDLSDAEIEVLQETWARFGHMTSSQIRKWTHENCQEYTEIDSGRLPITYADMMSAATGEVNSEITNVVKDFRRVASLFMG